MAPLKRPLLRANGRTCVEGNASLGSVSKNETLFFPFAQKGRDGSMPIMGQSRLGALQNEDVGHLQSGLCYGRMASYVALAENDLGGRLASRPSELLTWAFMRWVSLASLRLVVFVVYSWRLLLMITFPRHPGLIFLAWERRRLGARFHKKPGPRATNFAFFPNACSIR